MSEGIEEMEDSEFKSNVGLLHLSDCVLLILLSYVDATGLYNLSKTCKRLRYLVEDDTLWVHVDARRPANTQSKINYVFDRIHGKTKHLLVRGCANKNVWVQTTQISNIADLSRNLTILALEEQSFNTTEITMQHFPESLEELSLKGSSVSNPNNKFFKQSLKNMKNLKVLVLDWCLWLESGSLMSLSRYEKLEILSVMGCVKLENSIPYFTLAGSFGFKNLKVFDVRFTLLGDCLLKSFYKSQTLLALYFHKEDMFYKLDYFRRRLEILKGSEPKGYFPNGAIGQVTVTDGRKVRGTPRWLGCIADRDLIEFSRITGTSEKQVFPTSQLYEYPYEKCTCEGRSSTLPPLKTGDIVGATENNSENIKVESSETKYDTGNIQSARTSGHKRKFNDGSSDNVDDGASGSSKRFFNDDSKDELDIDIATNSNKPNAADSGIKSDISGDKINGGASGSSNIHNNDSGDKVVSDVTDSNEPKAKDSGTKRKFDDGPGDNVNGGVSGSSKRFFNHDSKDEVDIDITTNSTRPSSKDSSTKRKSDGGSVDINDGASGSSNAKDSGTKRKSDDGSGDDVNDVASESSNAKDSSAKRKSDDGSGDVNDGASGSSNAKDFGTKRKSDDDSSDKVNDGASGSSNAKDSGTKRKSDDNVNEAASGSSNAKDPDTKMKCDDGSGDVNDGAFGSSNAKDSGTKRKSDDGSGENINDGASGSSRRFVNDESRDEVNVVGESSADKIDSEAVGLNNNGEPSDVKIDCESGVNDRDTSKPENSSGKDDADSDDNYKDDDYFDDTLEEQHREALKRVRVEKLNRNINKIQRAQREMQTPTLEDELLRTHEGDRVLSGVAEIFPGDQIGSWRGGGDNEIVLISWNSRREARSHTLTRPDQPSTSNLSSTSPLSATRRAFIPGRARRGRVNIDNGPRRLRSSHKISVHDAATSSSIPSRSGPECSPSSSTAIAPGDASPSSGDTPNLDNSCLLLSEQAGPSYPVDPKNPTKFLCVPPCPAISSTTRQRGSSHSSMDRTPSRPLTATPSLGDSSNLDQPASGRIVSARVMRPDTSGSTSVASSSSLPSTSRQENSSYSSRDCAPSYPHIAISLGNCSNLDHPVSGEGVSARVMRPDPSGCTSVASSSSLPSTSSQDNASYSSRDCAPSRPHISISLGDSSNLDQRGSGVSAPVMRPDPPGCTSAATSSSLPSTSSQDNASYSSRDCAPSRPHISISLGDSSNLDQRGSGVSAPVMRPDPPGCTSAATSSSLPSTSRQDDSTNTPSYPIVVVTPLGGSLNPNDLPSSGRVTKHVSGREPPRCTSSSLPSTSLQNGASHSSINRATSRGHIAPPSFGSASRVSFRYEGPPPSSIILEADGPLLNSPVVDLGNVHRVRDDIRDRVLAIINANVHIPNNDMRFARVGQNLPPNKIPLRHLSLRGYTDVTDNTLTYLKHLSLEILDLTGTKTTVMGIDGYLAYNPNCRVIHPQYCKCKAKLHF